MSSSAPSFFDIPTPKISLRNRINALREWAKLPIIEVRVGSDSDLPKIRKILEWLREYPLLVRIASAHRTPEAMAELARAFPNVLESLESDNTFKNVTPEVIAVAGRLQVVICIAAAGGSAHIAGMTASETEIPVLAFPVPSSTNGQWESDPSMRHMPPGIPNGVSAFEAVLVDQAKAIYDRTSESWQKIYIPESTSISPEIQDLITRIWLEVIHTLEQAEIGIFPHPISSSVIAYENRNREDVATWVLMSTQDLWTKISITNPTLDGPIDTDDRTLDAALRKWITDLNLFTTPWLSMWASVSWKTNLTNALLFAAKIIAIHNEKVRAALAGYRHDLAHAPGCVRSLDVGLAESQLQ